MEMAEARKAYKKKFGEAPHHKTALKTILSKLDEAKPVTGEPPAKELEKLKSKPAVEIIQKTVEGEAKIITEGPPSQGIGLKAMHRLYFKGRPVEWSVPTIEAMSKTQEYRDAIEFPEGSQYEERADYKRCRQC